VGAHRHNMNSGGLMGHRHVVIIGGHPPAGEPEAQLVQ
jgi:hypothetical protein